MKISNSFFIVSGAAIGLLLPSLACAHDAWVNPGPGQTFPIYYGDKTPEAYGPEKVKVIKVYGADRQPIKYSLMKSAEGVTLKTAQHPALVSLFFDNGYWSKTPTGDKNLPRSQVTDPAKTQDVLKYSKTIFRWANWEYQPLGQRIEIVPLPSNNGVPKPGGTLSVRLVLNSEPLANAVLERDGVPTKLRTDTEGKATLPVGTGVQRWGVDYYQPLKGDPKADKLYLRATLVFIGG